MKMELNPEEILEVACQIERNGAAFYRSAAERVKDPASKKLLLELADFEDKHISFFDDMRADAGVLSKLFGGADNEASKYLQALAGGHIFSEAENPTARIKDDMSPQEIFKVAIELEISAVVFYQGIREVLTEDRQKSKLDALIHEEMRHVTILSNGLSDISDE
ncbi:MAG: ferritin family protein [Proteobacteria bacterium]|nr:ferritin family protein [Pseudomonadota bacterium]